MMADDEADFAIKQYGGVGLDIQDIGRGTCGYFQNKIFEQLSLCRIFNLQWVIFILAVYHDCYSTLTPKKKLILFCDCTKNHAHQRALRIA